MDKHKRTSVLASRVRFYYDVAKRTYDKINTADGNFIERYVKERDNISNDFPYHKLFYFEYNRQLYASNEIVINAAVNRTKQEFEDWYFEDYLLNKSKYERTH